MRSPVPQAERVAIGSGAGDPAVGNAAGGGAIVLDDDGLAERVAHVLRDDAPDRIRRPARRGTDNDRDRPRRLALRARAARQRLRPDAETACGGDVSNSPFSNSP